MAKVANRGERSQAIRDYLKEKPEATPREVVGALAEKGVEVKEGLVSNIKSTLRGPKRGRKRRMARRGAEGGMTKTEAVRAYLKENPSATAKDVIPALAAQGMHVSQALVSVVKYSKGSKEKRRVGRPARPGRVAASSGGEAVVRAQDLIDAKRLVDQLGGLAQAKQALSFLEQLQ